MPGLNNSDGCRPLQPSVDGFVLFEESRNSNEILTVTTVTNFCFTYPNSDGLYSPPLNSRKIGKWLKTIEKGGFSKVFEKGEKLSPPLRQSFLISANAILVLSLCVLSELSASDLWHGPL